LCVPSMGTVLNGFKSRVNETKIHATHAVLDYSYCVLLSNRKMKIEKSQPV